MNACARRNVKGRTSIPKTIHELLAAIRELHARGLLMASEGNFSYREGAKVWITPSGRTKATLTPEDWVSVPLEISTHPEGVSSEWPMHRAIYTAHPEVRFVFHSHPPFTIAASVVLPHPYTPVLEETRLLDRRFAVVEAPSGTELLGKKVAEALSMAHTVILRNHGVVTVGQTVQECLDRMLRVEREFQVLTYRKAWTHP